MEPKMNIHAFWLRKKQLLFTKSNFDFKQSNIKDN